MRGYRLRCKRPARTIIGLKKPAGLSPVLSRRSPMAVATQEAPASIQKARQLLEQLNQDASSHNIWVRTQMNAPAQLPWFANTGGDTGLAPLASGRVAANQLKTAAHHWSW